SLLAIPAATIDRVTDELLRQGHIARGYLGVGLQPIPLPEHLRAKLKLPPGSKRSEAGLIVLSVEPDGPTGQAGVLIGDVLIALDGTSVAGTDDVQEFLSGDRVGKPLTSSWLRGGELIERTITVGERPRRRA
ncbi:MAG TPA: S1C family serine protease, partial [Bryobacteraceae bacterium]|nr:S1C family serine protease [Bryobacteraceae bacterium]